MKEELRSKKQEEFRDLILLRGRNGILRASIRLGKTLIGLMTTRVGEEALVCYPRLEIKNSWLGDIEKFGYQDRSIIYSSFASLKKLVLEGKKFKYILVD